MVFGGMPPLRVGDEDWFYVIVCNGDHLLWRNNPNQAPYYHDRLPKSQTALYVQKHNRYVSLRAGNQPEVLITKPILVTGDTLQLNMDASYGEVRVGIAAAEPVSLYGDSTLAWAPHQLEGRLLPGFSFDGCRPILTNSIEHTVQFKNGANLESLKGQSVCLLFQMVDADLYGFRIYSIK